MNSDHRKYFDSQILPCHRRMYAAALAMLGSTDDAADAVQTAMLNIWEAVADGSRFDAPMSYALSALRNVCLSAIEKRWKNVGIDTVDAPEAPDAADALASALHAAYGALCRDAAAAGADLYHFAFWRQCANKTGAADKPQPPRLIIVS